jgi:hypothetical protein
MALRNAVEDAINKLESEAKAYDPEKLGKLNLDTRHYFAAQAADRLVAITELKAARKAIHGRVFDSMR